MLQDTSGARRRALSPLFSRAAAITLLAFGIVAPVSAAMQAAVGIYRCSTGYFYFDGDGDRTLDLKVQFPAPPAPLPACPATTTAVVGLVGDFNGNGIKAPVTFNNGTWSVDRNRDGVADLTFNFGLPGDIPLLADMNGDGIDDPVVYRNGVWFVGDGTNPGGVIRATYVFGGSPGDIPLLADVDGDGIPDLIIYRITGFAGTWYVSTKRNGIADKTFYLGGKPGDVPLAFDFNGDGLADLAIFRITPATKGTWYVSTGRNGIVDATYYLGGLPEDRPFYAGKGAVSTADLDAARFLQQAAFGPTPAEVANVKAMGYSAWIDAQFLKPETALPAFAWQPQSQPNNCTSPLTVGGPADPFGTNCPRDLYTLFQVQRGFFNNAVSAPDQLRQRVAWALSQILVTSGAAGSDFQLAYGMRDYQQMLIHDAFGNFQNLLVDVSLSPFMGDYLDMVNNDKANPVTGQQPNENYAREIMQLFSIGTLEIDTTTGGLLLDAQGQPIQTYDQTDINNLAKVMTGWTFYPRPIDTSLHWNMNVNYQFQMLPCEGAPNCLTGAASINHHDQTIKTVLGYTASGGLSAGQDLLTFAIVIFTHPNLGFTVGKQLIQHLVTSNPSNAYVMRVASVFNDNGSGVRGDMKAVVKAVLMDPEARKPRNPIGTTGKLKEPMMLLTGFLRNLNLFAFSDGVAPFYPQSLLAPMGQDVYQSPTVFNYYPADYIIPGTTLAGPQFGIYDPTTVFARSNTLYNWTLGAACVPATGNLCGPNADASVTGSAGTKIDWTYFASLAANPASLVDTVSTFLLYTTLPPGMRQQVINGVNGVTLSTPPTAAQLRDRARTAVYLIASSPKYQVEY